MRGIKCVLSNDCSVKARLYVLEQILLCPRSQTPPPPSPHVFPFFQLLTLFGLIIVYEQG